MAKGGIGEAVPCGAFLDTLRRLRVDKSKGIAKPYKPLLLAAVVLLIGKGKLRSADIALDGGLVSAFKQLLAMIFPDWKLGKSPDYPFRHLETDGVWKLIAKEGEVEKLEASRGLGGRARTMLRHVGFARMDGAVFEALAASPGLRAQVLDTLCAWYLPAGARQQLRDIESGSSLGVEETTTAILDEKALEETLARDWARTAFARLGVELATVERHGRPGRQVLTPVNAIDLLGYHPQKREWWVIELKHGRPADDVVGQVSRYLGWVSEECARRGESATGAIVARDANDKLRYAVRANPRLTLWTWDDELRVRRIEGRQPE
jgi:hypothetical protein